MLQATECEWTLHRNTFIYLFIYFLIYNFSTIPMDMKLIHEFFFFFYGKTMAFVIGNFIKFILILHQLLCYILM